MVFGAVIKKSNFVTKTACGHPALTVEPPSPAAQRCGDGAPEGPDRVGWDARRTEIQRLNGRGAPGSKGASSSFLSLRSLKSQVSEEICGRFGSFDGSTLAYRAGRASVR